MRTLIAAAALLSFAACAPGPKKNEPLPPAFYLVQGPDVRGETDVRLDQYGILICNKDLDPTDLRRVAPKATSLAYLDARWIATWGGPGTLYETMRGLFSEDDYLHTEKGDRVSVWDRTWELDYTPENARRVALFAGTHLREWDGLYLDDLAVALPDTVRRAAGLGRGAEWDRLAASWITYREALVAELRGLGFGVLVGNVGPVGVPLPKVDGICMEEWWPDRRGEFVGVCGTLGRPDLCIAWEWDGGGVVRVGDVRYR